MHTSQWRTLKQSLILHLTESELRFNKKDEYNMLYFLIIFFLRKFYIWQTDDQGALLQCLENSHRSLVGCSGLILPSL